MNFKIAYNKFSITYSLKEKENLFREIKRIQEIRNILAHKSSTYYYPKKEVNITYLLDEKEKVLVVNEDLKKEVFEKTLKIKNILSNLVLSLNK